MDKIREIKQKDLFRIEDNYFLCGDLEENHFDIIIKLLKGKNIYMVYSDPPWNKGNARYWRTHAGLSREVDFYNNFLPIFFSNVEILNPIYFFMEVPFKNYERILDIAKQKNFIIKGNWIVYYGASVTLNYIKCCGRPNRIICFSKKEIPSDFDPIGLKGIALTEYVFSYFHKKNEIVVDPCIGRGMTSRIAYKYNMHCYGMELNPKRLELTLQWLEKKGHTIFKDN